MDSATNLELQDEELEVLENVYGNEWKVVDEINRSYSIDIVEDKKSVTLFVKFTTQYPKDGPPEYQLSAPYLTKQEKNDIMLQMEDSYLKYIGESIVLVWIGIIKEFLNKKYTEQQINTESLENLDSNDGDGGTYSIVSQPKFNIIHGDTIIEKRSVFQGHVTLISSAKEVKEVLSQLYENKKIANATHNIYAYRIKGQKNSKIQDCDDDGETHAGGRLLHLLEMMDVYGVLVVVSRWYGGILLGPDRFKHISNAARQALLSAGLTIEKKK